MGQALSKDRTDVKTNEHGRFVLWHVPCWERTTEVMWHLARHAIAMTEEWASRRVAEGADPKVFLLYEGIHNYAFLASLLRRMGAIGVSVIVCEDLHYQRCPASESDDLFDIDLTGACWARRESPVGSERSFDGRRHTDEEAFLILKGPADLLRTTGKFSNIVRFPISAFPSGSPATTIPR